MGLIGRAGSRLGSLALAVGVLVALAGVGLVVWPQPGPGESAVEVPVTPMDLGARRAVTSPQLARDPTTPAFVVAATRTDAPGPDCGLQVSGDAGATWQTVRALEGLPEGVRACYAPEVGFTASGRLVFAFVGMAGPPPEPAGVWAVASGDHAQTFTQPSRLADVATTAVSLAVTDDGSLHLATLQPTQPGGGGQEEDGWPVGRAVVVASGDVGGLAEPVVVARPGGLVAGPQVVVGEGGGLTVAFWQLPEGASTEQGPASLIEAGPWRLMVVHRPVVAEEFSDPVEVATRELPPVDSRPSGHPRLVSRRGIAGPGLAAGGGRTCVSWTDKGGQSGLDAKVACTQDPAGGRWTDPADLEAGLDGETFQWLPQVAVDAGGRVSVVFYHHRQGAEDGRAVDVFYAATADPAAGFDEPVRLTGEFSLPDQAPMSGWFGTRLGLHTGPHGAVAAWADARNGVATFRTAQTIFAATIPTGAGPPGWAGLGLVAAGLAVAGWGLWWRRQASRSDPAAKQKEGVLEAWR